MTNAAKFNEVFRLFASEIWAMTESDFLLWLNGEYNGQERKTGKWIKDIYGNVVCSECRANRRDNRIGHIAFCNSCGSKMEVEE